MTRDPHLVDFEKCYDSRGFVSLALVLALVTGGHVRVDLFFGFFGLPTCVPSDPVYPLVMCITAQSSSPSRNPNDCPGCSGSDLSDAMWWTAFARLTLCDECRVTVRAFIDEYQAVWDLAPGGVAWAEQIAPNQFPDHPDGDWEGDDTGD